MSIKSYIVGHLFGAAIEQEVQKRLPAAGAGAANDTTWRRLTGNSDRELPIATWQRQVEICYWLWKLNPLGNWIIETLTNFVAGKGFTYTAKSEAVKAVMDDFWFDPVNRMDIKLEQKVRELFLFGVQCWPKFRAEQTGRIRLGMIDPANIVEVITDPENAEIHIGVKVQNLHTSRTRLLKTVLTGETETVISADALAMRETFTDGECYFNAINRVSNDPYGTSDLFVLADWLDEYEQFIYQFSGKAAKQNAYIWDVEIAGADETICQKFAEDYGKNPDGALRVHNEKVKWEAKAPNLQALEIKESAGVFRNHILGNKNMPEHWYGGGGDVNRNTASESNEPIKAFMDSRQNLVKFILETIFTDVIQSALDSGYLKVGPDEDPFDFAVQKPEAMEKDITKVAAAVVQLTTAIVAAQVNNWVKPEVGAKLFAFIIAMIGYELDASEMEEGDPGYQDYTDPESKNMSPTTGRETREPGKP